MATGVDDDLAGLAAARLAALLDRHAPGLVGGLHLVGSAIDGDFRDGRSDLDFVAVLSHPASGAELEALAILHRIYAADPTLPMLDGIWVTEPELAAGPDAARLGPTSHDNHFAEVATGNRNPVTWTQLKDARTMTGASLDPTRLWSDPSRLVGWVRENTEGYWRPWVARAAGWGWPGIAMLGRAMPMWGVLGISRQLLTVSTGEVVSKSAAGEWTLDQVERRWRLIIDEALRYRRRQPSRYADPFSRKRDAVAFVSMLVNRIITLHGP